jgi:multidrug efflux pump subunit AcrA (membrane-fusion protein)
MLRLIGRRLLLMIPTLILVSILIFALAEVFVPGSVGRSILGPYATEEQVQLLNEKLGADKPVVVRYLTWAGGFVTGDWGESALLEVPVRPLVMDAFWNSLLLAGFALVLIVPTSIALGVFAGLRRDSLLDRAITVSSLSMTVIPEFVSGVVLRLHQESETPVAAGTPLVEIGNPRELEIIADLLSTDAVKVKPGMAALVTGWGGDKTLRARVRLVEPAGFTKVSALGVEEQRVKVRLDFQDGEHGSRKLGDGYRVEVSLITSERQGVLKVPTSALFRTADRWAVFAVRGGRAAQTEIQVGERNAIEAEVTSGLDEGDEVIVHPGDTIEDGVAVTKRG